MLVPKVLSYLACAGFPKKNAKLCPENVALEITLVLSLPAAVAHLTYSWTVHVFGFALTNM